MKSNLFIHLSVFLFLVIGASHLGMAAPENSEIPLAGPVAPPVSITCKSSLENKSSVYDLLLQWDEDHQKTILGAPLETLVSSAAAKEKSDHLTLSKNRRERLRKYLKAVSLESLHWPEQQLSVSAHIIEIIYGDKFSLWKRLRLSQPDYQTRKHELIIREFLLSRGINDLLLEIKGLEPSLFSRINHRIKTLLRFSGLPWLAGRLLLKPLSYGEMPPRLQEQILMEGWAQSRGSIQDFFKNHRAKRDIYNEWSRPLGMTLGLALSVSSYFSMVDENMNQYYEFQKELSSEITSREKLMSVQRDWVEEQRLEERALLEALDQASR